MAPRNVVPTVYLCALIPALLTLGACGDDDGGSSDNQNNNTFQPVTDAAAQTDTGSPGSDAQTAGDAAMDPDGDTPDAGSTTTVTFTRHTVDGDAGGPAFVSVADLDGNGKLDLVVSRFGTAGGMTMPDGQVTMYEWGADLSAWSVADEIVTTAEAVKFPNHTSLADLDGDGDLDVVVPAGFLACTMGGFSPPCGALFWMEQTAGAWIRHDLVASGSSLFYHHAELVDFDGDGILDLVTVGEEMGGFSTPDQAVPTWFKGTTDALRFETTPRVMGAGLGSFPRVLDLDDDGDLDVAGAEFFVDGGSVAWLERTAEPSGANPAGSWTRHVIADDLGPVIMFDFVQDFYGDGVLRALSSNHSNTAQTTPDPWEAAAHVFTLPANLTQPWSKTQITSGIVSAPGTMFAPQAAPGIFGTGDIDGDGDIDVLLSGDGDPRVFWLEQTAPGTFVQHVLETGLSQAGGCKVVDLDGDGANELVVTGYEANAVYVYVRD